MTTTFDSFVLCEKCYEEIRTKNERACDLWGDLCKISSMMDQNNHLLKLKSADIPELRVLESMGYVVTTDVLDEILIKNLSLYFADDGQQFFCRKRGNHG